MAPLTASNCLEPPHGTGDLKARALWPDAFEATGGGIAEVEAALKVYLDEGYARTTAAGQSDETRANESARQWARYRAFRQRYETAITTPSSIGTDEGWSSSVRRRPRPWPRAMRSCCHPRVRSRQPRRHTV
jgi:hypothetical protein